MKSRMNMQITKPMFRAEEYTPDFPGFEGKDLTPYGTIEE